MKICQKKTLRMKILAVITVFVMMASTYLPSLESVAMAAAEPQFAKDYTYSYVLTNNSYKIKNLYKGDKVVWSISDDADGSVSFSETDKTVREVTSSAEGSTNSINVYTLSDAKDKIGTVYEVKAVVYNSKGKQKAVCTDKVIIGIDATSVEIINSPSGNTMRVSTSFDFKRLLTPYNSSNKTFWVVYDEVGAVLVNTKNDLTSTKVSMSSKGIFTPAETGTFKIVAEVYRSKKASVLRAKSNPITITVNNGASVIATVTPTATPSATPTPKPTTIPSSGIITQPTPVPTTAPTPTPETVINLSDKAVGFDCTTPEGLQVIKEIYESIDNYWTEYDYTTEDTSYTKFNLVVTQDSPLMNYINDGTYQNGSIIFIPKCKYFPNGLSLIYRSHDDNYGDGDDYNPEEFEIIRANIPGFADLLKDSVNIYSTEIDRSNPIAFVLAPGNTDVLLDNNSNQRVSLLSNETNQVEGAGFQLQNLTSIFNQSSLSEGLSNGSLTLHFDNAILYDKDGDMAGDGPLVTDNDRITLSGDVSLSNIKPTFGLDWSPSMTDSLPNQYINRVTYNENVNLNFTAGGKVGDLENLTHSYMDITGGYANKRSFAGIHMGLNREGVVVLGAIGINLTGVQGANVRTIHSASTRLPFNPIVVIYVLMDCYGNITTQLSFDYSTSFYQEEGVNIQKDGYVGRTGSFDPNAGTESFSYGDRNFNVFNQVSKSENERNLPPVSTLKVTSNDSISASMAFFGLGGASLGSITPVKFISALATYAEGNFNGSVTASSENQAVIEGECTGDLSLFLGSGIFVDFKSYTSPAQNPMIFQKLLDDRELVSESISDASITGKVFATDSDRDLSNNQSIANATVRLTSNSQDREDPDVYETTTGEDGSFQLNGLQVGTYTLSVIKEGYVTYLVNDYEVLNHQTDVNIYLDAANQSATLSGLVTLADEDTNATNNVPLNGITVSLKKIGSSTTPNMEATTNENGNYSFEGLPYGLYEISITSNPAYIPLTSEIVINSSNTTFYNITLEAISKDYEGEGTATGTVTNALSGQGVEAGLTLNVYRGYNVTGGELVATTTTRENGAYSLTLAAGNYTVVVVDNRTEALTKYKSGSFIIKVMGNKTIASQNGQVTPILTNGEIRIVLSWGEVPSDLDSHLNGPTSTDGSFHTFYSNKTYNDGNSTIVQLDVDDTSSYGPETTTIYKQYNGVYKFSVHDYTNSERSYSTAMANSGATVKVYYGDMVLTYYVPNLEGTVWDVFEYDSRTGEFHVLNNMYYQSDPDLVGLPPMARMSIMGTESTRRAPLKDYELEQNKDTEQSNIAEDTDQSNVTEDTKNSDQGTVTEDTKNSDDQDIIADGSTPEGVNKGTPVDNNIPSESDTPGGTDSPSDSTT